MGIAKALGNPVTIREKMAEEIGKHNLDDVLKTYKEFDLAGIAIPLNEDEVLAGAQVQHNKIVETIHDPNFGDVLQARPAAQFSVTPQRIKGRAPMHGERSAQVLKELGYSQAEVDKCAADKVISTGGGLPPSKL